MTQFIDKLNNEKLLELLNRCNFKLYANDFDSGNGQYHENDYLVVYTWNHNFANREDYVDNQIHLKDFAIKDSVQNKAYLPEFYRFMIETFGNEWATKAVKFFETHKMLKHSELIKLYMYEINQKSANVNKDC